MAQQRRATGAASAPSEAPSRKPKESDFYQQRLRSWQPIMTPRWLTVVFTLIGVVFIVLGIAMYWDYKSIVEVKTRYDTICANPSVNCAISFKVEANIPKPVYVYYELTNFYQNHRRYVRSKSDAQLMGKVIASATDSDVADCAPLITNGTAVLHPCGLIANSFFNGACSPQCQPPTSPAPRPPLLPPPSPPALAQTRFFRPNAWTLCSSREGFCPGGLRRALPGRRTGTASLRSPRPPLPLPG